MKYLIVIEQTSSGYSAYSPDLPGWRRRGPLPAARDHDRRRAGALGPARGRQHPGLVLPERPGRDDRARPRARSADDRGRRARQPDRALDRRLVPSGRPGRADPHLGDDRALEARHPDPPGLCHGRRGLPVVAGADRRGPADDFPAALPHQRPGLLRARFGGRPGRPRAPSPVLAGHVSRFRPPLRRHRVQRHRRHGGDADAPARAARRPRPPAAYLLHGSGPE